MFTMCLGTMNNKLGLRQWLLILVLMHNRAVPILDQVNTSDLVYQVQSRRNGKYAAPAHDNQDLKPLLMYDTGFQPLDYLSPYLHIAITLTVPKMSSKILLISGAYEFVLFGIL